MGIAPWSSIGVTNWHDCFVVNQHIYEPVPFDTLRNLFGQSLKDIGRAVVVLMDWEFPKYFARCWSVFELYTIMHNGIDHGIVMPEEDDGCLRCP